jgi:hypothetical protein
VDQAVTGPASVAWTRAAVVGLGDVTVIDVNAAIRANPTQDRRPASVTAGFQPAMWPCSWHIDSVESTIDYHVPTQKCSALGEFDGSVVERTVGEVSARCHDEQANFLALNLMNDIVTGAKTVEDARRYYAKEFLDYRRGSRSLLISRSRAGRSVNADTK